MKDIFKNILLAFSSPEEAPLSEAERLLAQIEETREQLGYAWNRLDYAAPDYVEIAVLELLLFETQYSLLNKRYRLLKGLKKEASFLPLEGRLQNHAFYGNLFSPPAENPSSLTSQLISQNPHSLKSL